MGLAGAVGRGGADEPVDEPAGGAPAGLALCCGAGWTGRGAAGGAGLGGLGIAFPGATGRAGPVGRPLGRAAGDVGGELGRPTASCRFSPGFAESPPDKASRSRATSSLSRLGMNNPRHDRLIFTDPARILSGAPVASAFLIALRAKPEL